MIDLSRYRGGVLPITEGWTHHSAVAYPSQDAPNAVMLDPVVSKFPVPLKTYQERMAPLGAVAPDPTAELVDIWKP